MALKAALVTLVYLIGDFGYICNILPIKGWMEYDRGELVLYRGNWVLKNRTANRMLLLTSTEVQLDICSSLYFLIN